MAGGALPWPAVPAAALAGAAAWGGREHRTPGGAWALADPGHRLTLQIHEDEPGRVGLLAVRRPAGPVQDVGTQLPRRLPGIGRGAQRSILG